MKMEFIKPVEWKDNALYVLNQLKLPMVTEYNAKQTAEDVFHAIKDMELRGAPLIGIAAGYGMYLGIKDVVETDHASFMERMKQKGEMLAKARPTASNLSRAIERMIERAEGLKNESVETIKRLLEKEAINIQKEEVEINRI
jgi:methylthioribose-1-phosphate isomerase